MEENDPGNREAAAGESNRANGPLLQAPGNAQVPHRVTNFFIDNILRPDFGRRKAGTPIREESRLRSRESPGPGAPPRTEEEVEEEEEEEQQQQQQEEEEKEKQGGTVAGGHRGAVSPHTLSAAKKPAIAREASPKSRVESGDQCLSSDSDSSQASSNPSAKPPMLWPAWVYCTRYSDRPSSGPRSRKPKKKAVSGTGGTGGGTSSSSSSKEDKRPRTAFTADQLQRLKTEFQTNRYLTEQRRQGLAQELGLNESQIKIWFQNKRAKIKKASGTKNTLALHLMAQGLYNHATTTAAKGDKSDSD